MTETTNRILQGIAAFQQELQQRVNKEVKEITEEEYIFLLSGPASCRMIPGIQENMGYEEMYYCKTEEDKTEARAYLKRLYAIEDLQTLKEACDDFYNVHYEFEQFQSFWDGTPVFDVNQLNPDACKDFTQSKDYAEHFLPFVGRRGFLAWDCNEKIAMARRTYACGLISEEDFWNFVRPLSQRANAYFKSWEEYAMSCFCGGLYFMFREQRNDEDKVENYYEISCNMLNHLFDTDGAWDRNGWFTYPGKKWVISAYEMKNLLVDWKGAAACIATDRILVDGCKVGYMYREEPDGDWDSGWRFMEGDETDDYMDDANNSGIYGLNTICNYSPDILPLLNAPYGTAYIRNKAGEFEEDRIEKRD